MRTRLDEIVDEETENGLRWSNAIVKRIAERAFRHGVERAFWSACLTEREWHPVQPAPAEEKPLRYDWVYKGGPLITNERRKGPAERRVRDATLGCRCNRGRDPGRTPQNMCVNQRTGPRDRRGRP